MKYERIKVGTFVERPNRFIAYVNIAGRKETVHVKNTGRCRELLIPGATVYVQESDNPNRKTKWDLIGVKKGNRMINMDSQITNAVVKEWIEKGNLFANPSLIKPETTYGQSRFDLYVEEGERKAFIEVKGVTLEEDGIVRFPDAPTERGVKHVEELCHAVSEGYEAYVIFVIQMDKVSYFTPNERTHKAFGDALRKAKKAGVHILAYDCKVKKDSISLYKEVPVILEQEQLKEIVQPIVSWYRENKRQLAWRENVSAYRVWVSEIMLQQTRVEAVKPFYDRFLKELPTVKDLAEAEEDKLLKLWEGLGYYNRVRNMQKAAVQVMEEFHGEFPKTYEEVLSLSGIGNYTAGAICSFAYGIPKPAVDGNVLRVISRVIASEEDIMKPAVRTKIEYMLDGVIPKDSASDFNQGLIELGALICTPKGMAKCEKCPLGSVCQAKKENKVEELPVKAKTKERRIENRTVFVFRDGENIAIRKRKSKGLLAGLYEFPNEEGHFTEDEVISYSKTKGLYPMRIKKLGEAKHVFSHVEWHMTGYAVHVDELEKSCEKDMLFIHPEEIQKEYPIPSAFEYYTNQVNIKLGIEKNYK
ncbi:A/G-specific adenine glycosylase [Lachnospiraceae bacterium 2_1_46FAA]|nr:A/G-specific adenine glycosylase [Lachnospiraceae bacterium 2_1_46FAA]